MKMKTIKYAAIITASLIVPIVVLYLMVAFILWDMRWVSVCETYIRVMFVIFTVAVLIISVSMGCYAIRDMKDKIK